MWFTDLWDSVNYRPEIRRLFFNHYLNLTIIFPIYFSALDELHKVKYFGKRKFSQVEYSFQIENTPSDAQYQTRLVESQFQYLYWLFIKVKILKNFNHQGLCITTNLSSPELGQCRMPNISRNLYSVMLMQLSYSTQL